mmetsp:Transcript_28704/g.87855  ORF Transcript_28704/g.87855 Transcript_28704/m.87855 type:complete len:282 (+) Transcript_28704:269-1114(+)
MPEEGGIYSALRRWPLPPPKKRRTSWSVVLVLSSVARTRRPGRKKERRGGTKKNVLFILVVLAVVDGPAAALEEVGFDFEEAASAAAGEVLDGLELGEGVEGGVDVGGGGAAAVGFNGEGGEAELLEDGLAEGRADDAVAGRRGVDVDEAVVVLALDVVGEAGLFEALDVEEILLGRPGGLGDGVLRRGRFAVGETPGAHQIADDDESAVLHDFAALDDFLDAVNFHDGFCPSSEDGRRVLCGGASRALGLASSVFLLLLLLFLPLPFGGRGRPLGQGEAR